MTKYYRVSLGKGGAHSKQAFDEGWVGTGWLSHTDLTGRFPENWRDFNREFVPRLVGSGESKNNISAGLACGMTWTVGMGIQHGDIIMSSNGTGEYHVGKVDGPYYFEGGSPLPHRRPVVWFPHTVARSEMSDELRRSTSSIGTVQVIEASTELEQLISGSNRGATYGGAEAQSPVSFMLEKHLEDFLVSNWANTELGRNYDIFAVDGEIVGRQYPSDTGPMDILAISKDGRELLVVELKRGRVSDVVVGQILRYMGYVTELDPSKTVRGVIIGTDDDLKIRRALAMTPTISYYRYEIDFKLHAVFNTL